MKTAILPIAIMLSLTAQHGLAANVLPQDGPGITVMTLRAERSSLETLSKSEGIARFPAMASLHRVNGNLQESNSWLEKCLADDSVLKQKGQGALYLCHSLKAGNQLTDGDIAGWARSMLAVEEIYDKNIKPALTKGDGTSQIEFADFSKFLDWKPMGSATRHRPGASTLAATMTLGVPVVQAKIKGGSDGKNRDVELDFVVDTGATRSILNEEVAQRLGINVTGGFASEQAGSGAAIEFGLAAPVNLELGNVTLNDVSFSTSRNIKFNLIGIDVLRRIGPIRISSTRLEIPESNAKPTCSNTFLYSSLLWGVPLMPRLPAVINGKEALILLDTGASTLLEASGISLQGFPPEGMSQRRVVDVFGERDLRFATSTVNLAVDGKTLTVNAAITDQKAIAFPVSWTLGARLLEDYSLYFDAARGLACLETLPRSGRATSLR